MKHEHFGMDRDDCHWDEHSRKVNTYLPAKDKNFFHQTSHWYIYLELYEHFTHEKISNWRSVRVSNELGAIHPRTAKFSLLVAVITSTMIGFVVSMVLVIFRDQYPSLFVGDEDVIILVKELTPILALSIVINNVQPVLSGNLFISYLNLAQFG